ncbi:hypothetical protein BDP81DRAFT_80559 [Colletotrichum phormii]|uniref:NACHT domain-containing protein n=1 Tax=Colletotrichum phormii TaxID=359342 RepID=A0AAJ0A0N0_9PEZI|nr:uncharacterized protein BDP81DRAFT_80559 [Colletotrichum phormii]KAK1654282.1 hypothetical protein BDP81DRAFT_80559 [Colletotrichum phormii]
MKMTTKIVTINQQKAVREFLRVEGLWHNSVNLAFSDAGSLPPPVSEIESTGPQTSKPVSKLGMGDVPKTDTGIEIWDWLAPEDYTAAFNTFLKQRHPGTLEWLFDTMEYRSSISDKGQMIFLPGSPGTGKSVLAASIVNDITERFISPESRVAYYFCPSQRRNRTTETLIRSLKSQKLHGAHRLPKLLRAIHKGYLKDGKLPSLLALLDVLAEAAGKVSRLFIIIDGFDILRSDQRHLLFKCLVSLSKRFGTNLFVTSRSINHVCRHFGRWQIVRVCAVEHDLRRYARAVIRRGTPSLHLDSEKLDEAETRVVKFSREIFSFATIILESISAEWTKNFTAGEQQNKLIDIFYRAEMKRNLK